MRIVYLVSAGTADPTRASIPLHLAANGSVDVGHEAAPPDVARLFEQSDRVVTF